MPQTLHFIEGRYWKDAVIALLDSRSPYRPWRYGFGEARSGDTVAVVLNTDPPSVLTALGRIGADGRPDAALINWPMSPPGLIDLATLAMISDFDEDPRTSWQLRGNDAIAMEQILTECAYRHGESELCGHSSVVAARILLHSEGECTGCGDGIDLTAADARDRVHVHTVDARPRQLPVPLIRTERRPSYQFGGSPESWQHPELQIDAPGVLCLRCRQHMRDEDCTSLVDFRFARHPRCPRCRAGRTQKAVYGDLAHPVWQPWFDHRGCVRSDDHAWTCSACGLQWW